MQFLFWCFPSVFSLAVHPTDNLTSSYFYMLISLHDLYVTQHQSFIYRQNYTQRCIKHDNYNASKEKMCNIVDKGTIMLGKYNNYIDPMLPNSEQILWQIFWTVIFFSFFCCYLKMSWVNVFAAPDTTFSTKIQIFLNVLLKQFYWMRLKKIFHRLQYDFSILDSIPPWFCLQVFFCVVAQHVYLGKSDVHGSILKICWAWSHSLKISACTYSECWCL